MRVVSSDSRGFSFIEALISLVIVSMVSTALYLCEAQLLSHAHQLLQRYYHSLADPESGMSSLEVLLTLLISMPTLIAGALLFRMTLVSYRQLRMVEHHAVVSATIHDSFSRALRDIDSAPWSITPRTHPAGTLIFAHGEQNPIMRGALERRPHPQSTALTSARFSPMNTYTVHEFSWDNSTLRVMACERFKGAAPRFDHYQSFLVASTTHAFEMVALRRPTHIASTNCYHFQLEYEVSMLTDVSPLLERPLIVVPIIDLWTLYVDRKGTLRYLSHSGSRNIENQPVIDEVPALKIEPGPVLNPSQLTISFTFKNNHAVSIVARSLLKNPRTMIDFLLNL